jgi:hypothetical protein
MLAPMRQPNKQQSVPAAGDVIRLVGVTKTYQAGPPPALADVSMDRGGRGGGGRHGPVGQQASPRCST